jgi:hypothetical protein
MLLVHAVSFHGEIMSTANLTSQSKTFRMKHFFLFLALLPPLVNAQQHYHLVRVVATGSTRYSSEDVAWASGLGANTGASQKVIRQVRPRGHDHHS